MLAINEEFISIQGEGFLSGTKMYFIRLQGCDVGCYFCDTKFTWKESDAITREEDIVKRVIDSGVEWTCITGGEPMEQRLFKLVQLLHSEGIKIQIETSGVCNDENLDIGIDHITLSPKTLFSVKPLNPKILGYASEIKCVVTKDSDIDYYIQAYPNGKNKYLQPVDNSTEITQLILNKIKPDWRISCQIQKILNLR